MKAQQLEAELRKQENQLNYAKNELQQCQQQCQEAAELSNRRQKEVRVNKTAKQFLMVSSS
jgi:hypothetical protein